MANWEKRRVGRTNLHVTSLGLGTARWVAAESSDASRTAGSW